MRLIHAHKNGLTPPRPAARATGRESVRVVTPSVCSRWRVLRQVLLSRLTVELLADHHHGEQGEPRHEDVGVDALESSGPRRVALLDPLLARGPESSAVGTFPGVAAALDPPGDPVVDDRHQDDREDSGDPEPVDRDVHLDTCVGVIAELDNPDHVRHERSEADDR